jgi:hypothetical protein
MAHWLVGGRLAVIIVDWSPLKADESWHLLRAAMSVGGRTLTLYEEVHSGHAQQSPRVHRAFLRTLRRLLPEKCRPIIVTDAGFRCPWFREVERLGWHFVGRVRNRVYVKLGAQNPWRLTAKLLESRRPLTAFGTIQLVRDQPFSCQLLRYCQVRQRRKHRTVRGQVSKSFASREAARAQREPWLIAYSNSLQAEKALRIVSLYRQRMQIEQSFRDLKCDRFGCAFAYSLTRHAARLSVLLLLHALATFLAWVQGCAQQRQQLTLHCAIRLTAKRAQYSTVRIGWESLRRGQPPTPILQRILRADVMPRWLLNLKPCAC